MNSGTNPGKTVDEVCGETVFFGPCSGADHVVIALYDDYTRAYYMASQHLLAAVLDAVANRKSSNHLDLLKPALNCMRQYVEGALKDLVRSYCVLHTENPPAHRTNQTILDQHDLDLLWNYVRGAFERAPQPPNIPSIVDVDRLIRALNAVDPTGEVFRYAYPKPRKEQIHHSARIPPVALGWIRRHLILMHNWLGLVDRHLRQLLGDRHPDHQPRPLMEKGGLTTDGLAGLYFYHDPHAPQLRDPFQ